MTGPDPHDLPPQEVLIESAISSLRPEMGTDFPFSTIAMFLEWYQSFNERRFDPANAYQDITPAPFLPRGVEARPSNIAYHEASVRRDTHALQNLRSAMSRSDRVMAVYGSGHLERTAPALSSLLTPRTPVARCRD